MPCLRRRAARPRRACGRLPLALITNGPSDFQRRKLADCGLERYFDAILVSGELGIAKPDVRIFERAMQLLGSAPVSTLHIGDLLTHDVLRALNAGLTAVWLNRRGAARDTTHPTPHHEIASLAELPALLI